MKFANDLVFHKKNRQLIDVFLDNCRMKDHNRSRWEEDSIIAECRALYQEARANGQASEQLNVGVGGSENSDGKGFYFLF